MVFRYFFIVIGIYKTKEYIVIYNGIYLLLLGIYKAIFHNGIYLLLFGTYKAIFHNGIYLLLFGIYVRLYSIRYLFIVIWNI